MIPSPDRHLRGAAAAVHHAPCLYRTISCYRVHEYVGLYTIDVPYRESWQVKQGGKFKGPFDREGVSD
jgi:hypothetical protein